MINTDKDWEEFAREDAYFSVLTQLQFAGIESDPEARRRFFESGKDHVQHVIDRIARINQDDPKDWEVLDFGCGVGRLLIPFAQLCRQAYGVDVSPTMLQEARRNIAEFGCGNAEVGSLQSIPANCRYDLIHSFIVFQHIPVRKGTALLRELLTRLKPGGAIALHFTFARSYNHNLLGWKLASRFPFLIPCFRLVRGQNPFKRRMLMMRYDLNEILQLFHESGMHRCEIEIVNDDGNIGAMIFGQFTSDNLGGKV